MSVSILDLVKESARQMRTGDEYWNKQLPWVFRLVCGIPGKGSTGPDGLAVFPLPVTPEQYEYSLPFAKEVTPQQEGGVVVEEAGIVVGQINIRATTGFRLRRQKTMTWAHGGGQFTGLLGQYGGMFEEISGQLSFWILANRCFEAYSQLKKDPQTAPVTKMELHILKEQLHLEVIPSNFTLTRNAASERVTYRFSVQLDVVGEAEEISAASLTERDIIDDIFDTISTIRDTVQSIAAAIDDLTAAMGQLERFFHGIGGFIDDFRTIIDSCNNLISGNKRFLDVPASFIESKIEFAESMAEIAENIMGPTLGDPSIGVWETEIHQTFLNLVDDLERLKVAGRDYYRGTWQSEVASYNEMTTSYYDETATNQAVSDAAAAGGTMTPAQVFEAPARPGDALRTSTPENRLTSDSYQGFCERVIGQGDTLQSLAARYLGDARRWLELAIVNNLSAPYITTSAKMPRTLQEGSRIQIPISKPVQPTAVPTAGQAQLGQSQAELHMGSDFRMVQTGKGRWGWVVDADHGSVDCQKLSGIDNLGQGLQSRLRTVRGEDILFPDLGLPRLVGQSQFLDPLAEARFRTRQQILADPRIERLISFEFSVVQDELNLTATVQPVGFDSARTISRQLT